MLADSFWGKGLASELVSAFVRWCREHDGIRSIAGGIAEDNPASKRVLEKAGFRPSEIADEGVKGEAILRLVLTEG